MAGSSENSLTTAPLISVKPARERLPVSLEISTIYNGSRVEFPQEISRILAIISAFLGLFVIGYIKGQVVEHRPLRSAVELFIIGSIATIVGVIVGYFLRV